MKIIKILTLTQKIILLIFITLYTEKDSFGQIQFVKTMYDKENYSEVAKHAVELNDFYLIPIISLATVSGHNTFYILKLSKNGKILTRKFYNDWEDDQSVLFNAGDNTLWKISVNSDKVNYYYYFNISLLDRDLNKLINIDMPRTHPQNGLLGLEVFYYLKLTNGDFIFMLDILANNWKPYIGEVYGNNFIY